MAPRALRRASARRRRILLGRVASRARAGARSSSPGDGGSRKMKRASSRRCRTWAAPLHLDLEEHVAAPARGSVERCAARPVVVAVVLRVLEEGARRRRARSNRSGDDEAGSRRRRSHRRAAAASCGRPRTGGPGSGHEQRRQTVVLPGARRRRDHERDAAAPVAPATTRRHRSSPCSRRAAMVSGLIADRITWSLSVTRIERVRRPWVASTSLPRFPASLAQAAHRRRDRGETIAITRAAAHEVAVADVDHGRSPRSSRDRRPRRASRPTQRSGPARGCARSRS